MFSIEISSLHWIQEAPDDPRDLCLHGDVQVRIGDTVRREDNVCASAGSLLLLRALTADHALSDGRDLRMLPCCGHAMYAQDGGETVMFIGCPYGLDWSVRHADGQVWLAFDGEAEAPVSLAEYRQVAEAFADAVWAHYLQCTPKVLPEDKPDREGYLAFWREWNTLRGRPFALPEKQP